MNKIPDISFAMIASIYINQTIYINPKLFNATF